jgi:hypothetical protein
MGLTLYYDWKTKNDAPAARRLVSRFRAAALKLPFDKVSEIYEQDPPDGKPKYILFDHPFRPVSLEERCPVSHVTMPRISAILNRCVQS